MEASYGPRAKPGNILIFWPSAQAFVEPFAGAPTLPHVGLAASCGSPAIRPGVVPSLPHAGLIAPCVRPAVSPIVVPILAPPCCSPPGVSTSVFPSFVPTDPDDTRCWPCVEPSVPDSHNRVTPTARVNPSVQAGKWKLSQVKSKKEEIHRLVVRATQQFTSSNSWSGFVGKCKYPRGDLCPYVQYLPHCDDHLLNRL
jgi:hypothetical protein